MSSCASAAGLVPDQLAEFVEKCERLDGNASGSQLRAKPKLCQLANGGGLQINADTKRPNIRHRFVDADRKTSLV